MKDAETELHLNRITGYIIKYYTYTWRL